MAMESMDNPQGLLWGGGDCSGCEVIGHTFFVVVAVSLAPGSLWYLPCTTRTYKHAASLVVHSSSMLIPPMFVNSPLQMPPAFLFTSGS